MCDLSPLDCIMNIEGNLGSFGSLLYKTSSGSQIFQSRFCCTFHPPWVIHNTQTQSDLTDFTVFVCRLHAQALTLAALAGCAVVEYYDHQSGEKAKKYEKHIQ
jgi:hypothetical protein